MTSRVLAALIVLWAMAGPVRAEAPDRYVAVISQVDLKRADGTWVRAARPDKPVDLAREEARVVFLNGARRPLEGEFVNFRILLEGSVLYRGTAQGRVTQAEEGSILLGADQRPAAYRSRAISADRPDGTGLATYAQLGQDGLERTVRFELSSAEDLSEPVRLVKGSTVVARFDVDLSSVLAYHPSGALTGIPAPGRTLPDLPRITSIALVVDDDDRVLDAGQVRLAVTASETPDDTRSQETNRWS